MAKEPTHTLNASELRATIAPVLRAYQSLAAVNDVLEHVITEETRLRTLTKTRTDAEQDVTKLRAQHASLLEQITAAKDALEASLREHEELVQSVRTGRQELDEMRKSHQAILDGDRQAHEEHMAAVMKQFSTETDRARQEHAAVSRQLEAAKAELAGFYARINPAA